MLTLIQVINYMMSELKYTEAEVCYLFDSVLREEITLEELFDAVGVEAPTPRSLEVAKGKVGRYKSALFAVRNYYL